MSQSAPTLNYAPPRGVDPEGPMAYVAGETSVRWRHFPAGALLLFALVALMLVTIAQPRHIPRRGFDVQPSRWPAYTTMIVCATLSGLMFWWEYRRPRPTDRQPDILTQLFPPKHVLKIGTVHAVMAARQSHHSLKLMVVVQNRRDGPGRFTLRVSGRRLGARFPVLDCDVPGSGVVLATALVPVRPPASAKKRRLHLRVTRAKSAGRTVRFADHKTIGVFLPWLGWDTWLGLQLAPTERANEVEQASEWSTDTIWSVDAPIDAASIAPRIAELSAKSV